MTSARIWRTARSESWRRSRPDPLFLPKTGDRIRTGGFDDLTALASADWIIEAIIESPEPKRRLLEAVDASRAPGSIVSTNTSGLSIAALCEGRSADFRAHWLGTHFFNPPRYMHLVELVPTTDTDPSVTRSLTDFLDRRLGKGVVPARDTPAFIANRLGMHGVMQMLAAVAPAGSAAFTPPLASRRSTPSPARSSGGRRARPSARSISRASTSWPPWRRTWRPGCRTTTTGKRSCCRPSSPGCSSAAWSAKKPDVVSTSECARLRANPASSRSTSRRSSIATRSPCSCPSWRTPAESPAWTIACGVSSPARTGPANFCAVPLSPTLLYAANIADTIAYSRDDVDRAMRWGFGWERGPFETWDAIGDACRRCPPDGRRARSAPLVTSRTGLPAAPAGQGRAAGCRREIPAPASSTWATACSRSSSTRR